MVNYVRSTPQVTQTVESLGWGEFGKDAYETIGFKLFGFRSSEFGQNSIVKFL